MTAELQKALMSQRMCNKIADEIQNKNIGARQEK